VRIVFLAALLFFDAPTRIPPPPSAHAAREVLYEDITASSGLAGFRHAAGGPMKPYLPETVGSGVALFDYNNDGWLDIYLVNALSDPDKTSETSALFRNNKDGTFTDVTCQAGLQNQRWGTGVCAGDYNNDGYPDLYVGNLGRSRLYRNNGDGTFTDVADRAGVAVDTWSTGCAFGDYDRDGLLDLYVAGYVDFDWKKPPPAGESSRGETKPGAMCVTGEKRIECLGARVLAEPSCEKMCLGSFLPYMGIKPYGVVPVDLW
jgi:hypothetical protein